jgi:ubiquinone/menaquinone biosynthesis C-methylase UbiE
MNNAADGQVSRSAADVYEEFFVPALFQEWAGRVADAAALEPGHKVLDVACGTGVLARSALDRVGPGGAVTGLDRNDGMLVVARRKSPGIDWRSGRAEALPFADDTFDAVVSQFGLMFFEDRVKALAEMSRVLRRGGRLAVAVWASLDRSPGYRALTALIERLFGKRIASELEAPFVLGDSAALGALFARAGIVETKISTRQGSARFPSLEEWLRTEIKGWTLADLLDDAQYEALQRKSARHLSEFVRPDRTVEFTEEAHIVTAVKP